MEVVEEEVDNEDKDEQDIEAGGPVAGTLGEEVDVGVNVDVAEPQVEIEADRPRRSVDESEGVCDTAVAGM